MTDIIFRVDGIPLPQPKLKNSSGWRGYFRDNPIRLRHPQSGRLLKIVDNISGILWPHGTPRIKADKKGIYWLQVAPRAYWKLSIQEAAIAKMQQIGATPFPQNHPLLVGCVFIMPSPIKRISPLPMDCDYDNLCYAVWNAIKKSDKHPAGICFYDDNQIVGPLPGNKIYATTSPSENPGAIIWISPAGDNFLSHMTNIKNKYLAGLADGEIVDAKNMGLL